MAYRSHEAGIDYPAMSRQYRFGDSQGVEVDESVRIEAQVIVEEGTIRPTRIGANTWLMHKVLVGHDSEIGANCEIATGSIIGGHVRIGDNVRLGIGTLVKPRVVIGDGARTGIGAIVTRDIPPGELWTHPA